MTYSNLDIDYQIIRSKRKTVSIVVNDGEVEVRAPHKTPKYWLEEFVSEKQSWIKKQLTLQRKKEKEHYRVEDGAVIPFMGASLMVKVTAAKVNRVKLDNDQLKIDIKNNSADERCRLVDQWLLQQAKMILPEIITIFSKEMDLYKKLKEIKFRKTKSKWGHCTHDGVLQLNQLILLAPENVQKYLIIHELCHLVHLNHSKAYWALVSKHFPLYKEAQDWLRDNGHRLWYK